MEKCGSFRKTTDFDHVCLRYLLAGRFSKRFPKSLTVIRHLSSSSVVSDLKAAPLISCLLLTWKREWKERKSLRLNLKLIQRTFTTEWQNSSTAAPNLINSIVAELRLLWQILSLDGIQFFLSFSPAFFPPADEFMPSKKLPGLEHSQVVWVLLWKVMQKRIPSRYPAKVDTIIHFQQNQRQKKKEHFVWHGFKLSDPACKQKQRPLLGFRCHGKSSDLSALWLNAFFGRMCMLLLWLCREWLSCCHGLFSLSGILHRMGHNLKDMCFLLVSNPDWLLLCVECWLLGIR